MLIHPNKLPPVLIVGARTMGLAVLRSLKDMDIERIFISYDRDDSGRASRYVNKIIDSPHPESQLDQFAEFMIDLAKSYSGAVIFPASDISLKAISKKKAILRNYFIVGCPEWSIVESIINKKLTYELAEKSGVPCPKTYQLQSVHELEQYLQKITLPCLIKPTQSHLYFSKFHRKMMVVNNKNEAINAYKQASEIGLEVVLQEFIPGPDSNGLNYNSYALNGDVIVEFTGKKIRSAPPNLGSPCVVKSAVIPEIHEVGRKLIASLGFYGYSCTEFKLDPRDGIYKLMEINGRHNLSGILAVYCGMNFPEMHYRHLVLGEIPSQSRYEEGKYWIDLARDFAYYLPLILHGKLSISDFCEPYLSKHVYAILDANDMGPAIKRYKNLFRDVINHKRSLYG
jgi:D-aspartate ligase